VFAVRLLVVTALVVEPKLVKVDGSVVVVLIAYSYPVGAPPVVGADQLQAIDEEVTDVEATLLTTPGGFNAVGVADNTEDHAEFASALSALTQKYCVEGDADAVYV
jgi:hypothetical protein